MKKILFFVFVTLCLMSTQCEDDDFNNSLNCDYEVVIDEERYNNLVPESFIFENEDGIKIMDDCLFLTVTASGCSGDSWEFSLIDSGAVAESLPEQRFLKLEIKNEELCDAIFIRTISFDLSPIQIEGSNKIILNIEGLQQGLTYTY